MSFRVSRTPSGSGVSFVSIRFNGESPKLKADIIEGIRMGGDILEPHVVDGEIMGAHGHVYDERRTDTRLPTNKLLTHLGSLGGQIEYLDPVFED